MPIYGPSGDPATAKFIILTESPTAAELSIGRPLVGPAGSMIDESLRRAGLSRRDCYITTVFSRMIKKNKKTNVSYDAHPPGFELWSPKHGFTAEAEPDIERLKADLDRCSEATTILALGGMALSSVAGIEKSAITKYRGSIYPSKISDHKVIGTIHPSAVFQGNFEWRYLIDFDTRRVAHEMLSRGIRDLMHNFEMAQPFQKVMDTLAWIKRTQRVVAWDIEVIGKQCAMVGFAWTAKDCVCVNLPAYTLEQETHLWIAMADIIEDENIENVVQNGMFDVSFLSMHCSVRTRGKIHDTMLKHNLMYHEFPAGLAFMQSLYTDIPYHKDMVKHGEVEKDEG